MPIAFHCPACQKKYRVEDSLAGRKAKCKGCGESMEIPQLAAVSGGRRTIHEESFSNPYADLAAVAAQEEGGSVSGSSSARETTSRCPGCGKPLGVKAVICLQCGYNRKTGKKLDTHKTRDLEYASRAVDKDATPPSRTFIYTVLGFLGAAIILAILAGTTSENVALVCILAFSVIAGGFAIVGRIWGLVVAFQNSIMAGLCCLFIPFFSFVYALLHWDDMKKPFLLAVLGGVLCVIGSAIIQAVQP